MTAASGIKAPTLKSFITAHSLCKAVLSCEQIPQTARDEQPKYNPVQSCAAVAPQQQDGSNLAGGGFDKSCNLCTERTSISLDTWDLTLLVLFLHFLSTSDLVQHWLYNLNKSPKGHDNSKKWPWMHCCFSFALFSLSGFNCVINHSSVIQPGFSCFINKLLPLGIQYENSADA